MSRKIAELCLDMAGACGVRTVMIVGGEPTLHSELFKIIDYAHNQKMRVVIVSNGILLAQLDLVNQLAHILNKNDSINISMKGASASDYSLFSPNDSATEFDSVCQCLINLKELNVNHSISYVVSRQNVASLKTALGVIRRMSNANIGLSLCGPCLNQGRFVDIQSVSDVCRLANDVFEIVSGDESGRMAIHVNVPLCHLKDSALNKISWASFSCHVLDQSGLVFDTNGDLLLCNHLLGLPVGSLGNDYDDPSSFVRFIQSDDYMEAWSALSRLPYSECSSCKKLDLCRGGCPLLFF